MKYDLDKVKLGLVKPISQVTYFRVDGRHLQSCNTILLIDEEQSIYDRFDFLASMEDYFQQMEVGEELRLNPMEWHEDVQGLFVVRLAKIDAETIQWILFDKSIEQERIKAVLESRDKAVLNEEYLKLKRHCLRQKRNS
jgi:hypothetical protein